ncbi:MAG: hypothetical protein E7103_06055 [Prevotella sp.]|jgi:hypothetical protein|nr:hypothetical protein [Prevotella sp.]
MRSVLLLLFTFLGLAVVRAEDYAYLTIVGADGGKTSLTAVGLTLSFSDDNLVARNAYTDESLTLPLSSLASMNFSNDDETTGITSVHAVKSGDDAVYTIQGLRLPVGTPLKKGIYIVRKGSTTQKVQVK